MGGSLTDTWQPSGISPHIGTDRDSWCVSVDRGHLGENGGREQSRHRTELEDRSPVSQREVHLPEAVLGKQTGEKQKEQRTLGLLSKPPVAPTPLLEAGLPWLLWRQPASLFPVLTVINTLHEATSAHTHARTHTHLCVPPWKWQTLRSLFERQGQPSTGKGLSDWHLFSFLSSYGWWLAA